MPAAVPKATCMKKLLFLAALAATLTGSALAQDTTNKDQAAQPKTDQAAPTPTTKTFADYEMGMAFDYPSTWVLVADPKAPKSKSLIPPGILGIKKKKGKLAAGKQASSETLFYIPANTRTANLEIYSALWDQTPDLWESVQNDANKQLNRTVVKQWREEILGVPLLLTKIAYDDAAGHEVGLTGLVYSRTPYKMQFRLTAPDTDYDAAEFELRQALQSLRTTQGDMPQPEDPNHPLDKTAYTSVVNTPPRDLVMVAPKPDTAKAKKGDVSVPLTVADRKILLTMPTGWTSEVATDGSVTLHNPAVAGTITVTLASTLDSDPPQAAVLKASAQSLDMFAKVDKREEKSSDFSGAGATTNTIWRWGTGEKGIMTTCEAYGATSDLYWLLRYHLDSAATPSEIKAVDALIDCMSADPAP
jgi:hypothetical protein